MKHDRFTKTPDVAYRTAPRVQTPRKKLRATLYSTNRWKKLRASLLPPGKLCEMCGNLLAWQVHHKKSPFDFRRMKIDEVLAYDVGNLQAVCAPCHDAWHKAKRSRCGYCGKFLTGDGDCEWCGELGV